MGVSSCDSWVADLAVACCGGRQDLDVQPFNEGRGCAMEQNGPHHVSWSTRSGAYDDGSEDVDDSSLVDSLDSEDNSATWPIDLESNELIWHPPPPQDETDDFENGFLEDADDDNDAGDGRTIKGKHNTDNREFLRNALHGHFRALVSQLLKGHGVDPIDGWSNIISSLAWQAATFVKPDTIKSYSMDPTDYVKIKRVASGNPNDSTFIKGIVCSKNVQHKLMVSKHENPRLLLLGGALEYQRVSNNLESFNNLFLQQEEYLKNAVANIEAQRPHVLLVEKSVARYAQQQFLEKDISLVMNVKRPLLERISRCTGAQIVSCVENVTSARLGQCQTFRIERVTEPSSPKSSSKKSVKALMFFDGCPRPLGCTVLLRGTSYEELSKVKLALQFALCAAIHLSLETSYIADEGATLPKTPSDLPVLSLEKHIDAFSRHISDEKYAGEATRDHNESHIEHSPASENSQSILVSLSTACPLRGIVCKKSELFCIKFYGSFDKPLGRYLHELFDQTSCCESCKEPAESHVRCYTHQQHSFTIRVKNLASVRLSGVSDGKIWMWHRCLRCKPKNGIPPATQRVVMSDEAFGLSFGKFLDLNFSNHTTANRIASCGHSLQRDCLRFYGFGSMVAVLLPTHSTRARAGA